MRFECTDKCTNSDMFKAIQGMPNEAGLRILDETSDILATILEKYCAIVDREEMFEF